MKRCLFRCIVVFVVSAGISFTPAWGFPFRGDEQRLGQPDGSYVKVRVWGDEYYQRVESLDGYTLVRDPQNGGICYAELAADGNHLKSTGIRVQERFAAQKALPKGLKESKKVVEQSIRARTAVLWGPEADSSKSLSWPEGWVRTTSGDVKGITLVVDFPDEAGTINTGMTRLFLNYPGFNFGGNTGSVYDYYVDVSNNQLHFTNWCPDVYYTAQHEKGYYDDPSMPTGPGAKELILEALNYYDSQGFDFSQYDSNGDGYIDGISCLFAGSSVGGFAMGLTPHAGSLQGFEADGVKAVNYQITPMFEQLNMAMFAHECGHMLFGWPDLYDHDFDATGMGEYCMMSYGTYPGDPVHVCAYLKEDVGWSQVTTLTASLEDLTLLHPAFRAYKFPHPYNPREYFLVENRQQRLRDTRIWDSGLMILHVDKDGSNIYNQMTPEYHYKVALQQADGRFDLEHNVNRGDNTDLYSAPGSRVWGPGTLPNTKWWDGSESDFEVYDVGYSGTVMRFSFRFDPKVVPVDPVSFSGDPLYGGTPFEALFQFTNAGAEADAWQSATEAAWIGLEPSAGSLEPGETVDITARVASAALQSPGEYSAVIRFELTGAGKFWNRKIIVNYMDQGPATADTDKDWSISLSELLLGIQLYQSSGYHCAPEIPEGFAPDPGENYDCIPYSADYAPQDWVITVSELLRLIQFYNIGGYYRSFEMEDGFSPGSQ